MNELHNMNLPLLLPLSQVQIYELNLKILKCLRMDVERGDVLFTQRKPSQKTLSLRYASLSVKERLINQSKTDLNE